MKTVILCGGEGTRLKEETEYKPKPLVQVGGMPILWHIMKIYSHYGFNDFVLPLGYKGDMIKEFFIDFNWRANDFSLNLSERKMDVHENHRNEDWNIHFVDTGLKAKTALRLYRVKKFLEKDDRFMLTYGDGLSDVDISELIRFHIKHGKLATITGVNVVSRFGVIETDGIHAKRFCEKPVSEEVINGGFMVLERKALESLNDDDAMLEEEMNGLLPRLAERGEVSVYRHCGFWHCMDTYRDYLRLEHMWGTKPLWKVWDR